VVIGCFLGDLQLLLQSFVRTQNITLFSDTVIEVMKLRSEPLEVFAKCESCNIVGGKKVERDVYFLNQECLAAPISQLNMYQT